MAAAGALLGPVYDWLSAARPQAVPPRTRWLARPARSVTFHSHVFGLAPALTRAAPSQKSRISAGPRAAKLCGGLSKARQQPLDPFAQTSGLFGLTPLISCMRHRPFGIAGP
jgi:hypothetical protein